MVSSATKKPAKKTKATAGERLVAYKGFDRNLVCNPTGLKPFQYEIGKTYTTDTAIVRCASGGFHSVTNPLDVFTYYAPGLSRYCEVEIGGKIARDDSDSKVASAEITIKAELKLPDLIDRAIKWLLANIEDSKKEHSTGTRSAASSTGTRSAASSTGTQSAASSTGYQSAASSTGTQSAASSTGTQSAASSTGYHVVSCGLGIESRAMASETGAIVLCHRDPYSGAINHIRASKVGDNGIKPDVWYSLDATGEFVEA